MPNQPRIYKLSNDLRQRVSVYTKDKDNSWVQFIEDHRSGIVATSSTMAIDPEVMGEYLYRPTEFAIDHLKLPNGMEWIFTYINDIKTVAEFNLLLDKVYVPDSNILSELRQKYKVHMANINRNETTFDRHKR